MLTNILIGNERYVDRELFLKSDLSSNTGALMSNKKPRYIQDTKWFKDIENKAIAEFWKKVNEKKDDIILEALGVSDK